MNAPSALRVTSRGSTAAPRLGGARLIALMAFLVPAIAFVVLVTTVAVWESSRAAEQAALQRAREIIARVDTEIRLQMESIKTVAAPLKGVAIVQSRPDPERARVNAALFPEWVGSLVWPLDGSRAVFSALPMEEMPEIPPGWAAQVGNATGPVVGGVERVAGLPAVLLHQRIPDDPRGLVLTIALRPEAFRDIVMSEIPAGSVGALVDRDGNFIARSLDQERRVGTPATQYVREAVAKGGEGAYRGMTYEGLENISTYHTSELTGWSMHVAIYDRLVDAPASLAVLVAVGGGVLSFTAAGLLIWLVMRDTRRRQQTELALAQAQRVESLGRLTGGIAHDFNNMLTVIIGNLERAGRLPGPAQAQAIDAALGSARQAANLTRSLMLYSRHQPLAADTVNLNDCVRETAAVAQRTLGAHYQIEKDLDEAAGAVRVDTSQLASALLNLAINARDAMPAGGRVILRTRRRTIAAGEMQDLPAGDYAEISIIDTGEGMPPEIARRAFEPFFTTKDVGKGTGLGLSQVDGFARQSGGAAELETAPGIGTTVSLCFPRVADTAVAVEHVESAANAVRALRVLLVEDNAALREHAINVLQDQGHSVVAMSDAQAAEPALRRETFDLLFSDIVLPGAMSGVDLAARAREVQPGIAVVLATGYARDELQGATGAHPVILKPYSAVDVARAIEQAVAARVSMQRVLLVEDEPFIALSGSESLTDAGHHVIVASTAAEAREIVGAEATPFDVAIIDIGLPDGSGLDLAVELHVRQPGLRVIISSGQAPASTPDWVELLPKPYGPDEIVAAVARG